MRILLWHVHGSWTNSFVQGNHTYLLPVLPSRGPDGLGRARTWDWPASVVEIPSDEAASTEIDLVVAQRHEELAHLIEAWTRRRPGIDLPCVYLEHNTPTGSRPHPAAGYPGVPIVHVTHFNRVMWNNASAPTRVIEHGVVDPGHLYSGELPRAVAVINDPESRGRVTGTDLLIDIRQKVNVDLFGMRSGGLGGRDVPQSQLHHEMARRRVYLHPNRWTSLGLSLIEAMHLGMPVVGLAATEIVEAVGPDAGVVSTRPEVLAESLRRLIADPHEAREKGAAARQAALRRYGLKRFLDDWDRLIEEVVR